MREVALSDHEVHINAKMHTAETRILRFHRVRGAVFVQSGLFFANSGSLVPRANVILGRLSDTAGVFSLEKLILLI